MDLISLDRKYFWITSTAIVIIIIVLIIMVLSADSKVDYNKKYDGLSFEQKRKAIDQAWDKWKKIQAEQLSIEWIIKYQNFNYSLGGNPTFKYIDCSQAIINKLWDHGYYGEMKNVKGLVKEFKRLGIKPNKTPKPKDILILDMNKKIPHCALVIKVKNNRVLCVDVNSVSNGYGHPEYHVRSNKIYGSYPITYEFFKGNLDKEKN